MKNIEIKQGLYNAYTKLKLFSRFILAGLALIYLCSGIYSVSSNQVGVLLLWEKVVNDKVTPGIHYAPPWPFYHCKRVAIRRIDRLEMTKFHREENVYCITGDNNLINLHCVIHYQISSPTDFLYRIKDSKAMLEKMAQSSIIYAISQISIDQVLTSGKQELAFTIESNIQQRLDLLNSGLSISSVELKDVTVPKSVQQSFSSVVNAKIGMERAINDAHAYANQRHYETKAESDSILQLAHSYKQNSVEEAKGDSERYRILHEKIQREGATARNVIHLEKAKQAIENAGKKYMLSPTQGGRIPAEIKIKLED